MHACVGYDPADNYLIDCGSSTVTTVGDRSFLPDGLFSSFLSVSQYTLANTTAAALPTSITATVQSPLYLTAAIFNKTSTYTFPIRRRGRLWIRLYFFPFVYGNYNLSTAHFSVSAQNHLLLANFNPIANASTLKEYSINVTTDTLVITFTPSHHSLAFLSALEVVSVPDDLITDENVRGFSSWTFQGLPNQALETIARANIGTTTYLPQNDDLWRTWLAGRNFLLQGDNLATHYVTNITAVKYVAGGPTRDIAPEFVYGTAVVLNSTEDPSSNHLYITWQFILDLGYRYLLRFHFCNILAGSAELSFAVYIDSWLVTRASDFRRANASGAPFYFDVVTDPTQESLICVSITPSFVRVKDPIGILNGVEIMKLNNSLGNLSEATSDLNATKGGNVIVIVGVSIGVLIIVALVGIFFWMIRRKRKKIAPLKNLKTKTSLFVTSGNAKTTGGKHDADSTYWFPIVAIEEATNNFDETRVIGIGGFGKVYLGVLRDGTKVAVKRSNPQSKQGLAEFQTEIELLSQFRHRHLVSLIGYCDEKNEMILIYEYMENGTLKSHLYGCELPSLSWKERLEICIGSARGLHYLHTGSIKPVIHRDVKSANILLDEHLIARVADFGLSRTIPENDQTHVSTAVRGTFGYLDPEYFKRRRLTAKSDVYSFGVVLFEVLCARPVLDSSLSEEMEDLAEWVMKKQKTGQLEQIIDPNLVGKIKQDSLRKFVETAEKCLADHGADRPSMEEVLYNLEHALQLEEIVVEADSSNYIDASTNIDQFEASSRYD
ncbi:probable receptor-like protein kinase At5g59700 [Malania oleifera]|uniref:probable receptor-like protein kinase At5g59700 n=1 Tax=Malania oleifera TaxID=397392 RepID=UPI0025ADC97D|nr:probable receptor-like protein kinase At5g59700 [Malania oleifera]